MKISSLLLTLLISIPALFAQRQLADTLVHLHLKEYKLECIKSQWLIANHNNNHTDDDPLLKVRYQFKEEKTDTLSTHLHYLKGVEIDPETGNETFYSVASETFIAKKFLGRLNPMAILENLEFPIYLFDQGKGILCSSISVVLSSDDYYKELNSNTAHFKQDLVDYLSNLKSNDLVIIEHLEFKNKNTQMSNYYFSPAYWIVE